MGDFKGNGLQGLEAIRVPFDRLAGILNQFNILQHPTGSDVGSSREELVEM
jgi:hypothetical protein